MRLILIILLLNIPKLWAQNTLKGRVLDEADMAIAFASISWLNDYSNATFADSTGYFEILKPEKYQKLLISAVGFASDTLNVGDLNTIKVVLRPSVNSLDAVLVKGQAVIIDRLSGINTEVITTKALAKAACCNLSESFETSATVSVNYTDAVTGIKQLEMLGLSGKYIQVNVENTPNLRGLATAYGLNFIPGTWIQSIDVSKGATSVVNGYESMAGSLNVELIKPNASDNFLANAYINSMGRAEGNLNYTQNLSKKWSAAWLIHGSAQKTNIDNNLDGFLDTPKFGLVNLLNRYKYDGERVMAQMVINHLEENRLGGHLNEWSLNYLPFENTIRRTQISTKTALLFPEEPYRGLGLIMSYTSHRQQSDIPQKYYNGWQRSFYANLIFQGKFSNTQHTYKTGASWLFDNFSENIGGTIIDFSNDFTMNRQELTPGAFFEYTLNKADKLILMLGQRVDHHSLFGWQFTPRFHFKMDVNDKNTIRLNAGKAFRVPNPYLEAIPYLMSNRKIFFNDNLMPEKTWNFGGAWQIAWQKNSFSLDYYHTQFGVKQIFDMARPSVLNVYYSEREAYAATLQADLKLNFWQKWELNLAARRIDNKQTYGQGENTLFTQMFFTPKYRALLNLAYALPYNKWKFDYTIQFTGRQLLPNNDILSSQSDLPYALLNFDKSPAFVRMNTQVNRNYIRWEYYIGIENLGNYRQLNPVILADNISDARFDATQVWGPLIGRMFYFGFKYKIK